MRRNRSHLLIAMAVLAAVAFYLNFMVGPFPESSPKPLPRMTLPVILQDGLVQSGKELSLSDLKGKPVLVHWWASWCSICKSEMPDILSFYEKHRDSQALEFIAIATAESKEASAGAAPIWGFPYRVLFEETSNLAHSFGARGLPFACLFDAQGMGRYCWQGSLARGKIREIEIALAKIVRKDDRL